jgi:hypothetical protein
MTDNKSSFKAPMLKFLDQDQNHFVFISDFRANNLHICLFVPAIVLFGLLALLSYYFDCVVQKWVMITLATCFLAVFLTLEDIISYMMTCKSKTQVHFEKDLVMQRNGPFFNVVHFSSIIRIALSGYDAYNYGLRTLTLELRDGRKIYIGPNVFPSNFVAELEYQILQKRHLPLHAKSNLSEILQDVSIREILSNEWSLHESWLNNPTSWWIDNMTTHYYTWSDPWLWVMEFEEHSRKWKLTAYLSSSGVWGMLKCILVAVEKDTANASSEEPRIDSLK